MESICSSGDWNKGCNCAADPWTYRTDTGDETGKIVEDAELPEEKLGWILVMIDHRDNISYPTYYWSETTKHWIYDCFGIDTNWLRKHLVAWAEIRR